MVLLGLAVFETLGAVPGPLETGGDVELDGGAGVVEFEGGLELLFIPGEPAGLEGPEGFETVGLELDAPGASSSPSCGVFESPHARDTKPPSSATEATWSRVLSFIIIRELVGRTRNQCAESTRIGGFDLRRRAQRWPQKQFNQTFRLPAQRSARTLTFTFEATPDVTSEACVFTNAR